MKDRLMRGGYAGAIGGVWVLAAQEFFVHVLHFGRARWLDSLSSLLWAHPVRSSVEWFMAALMTLILLFALGYVYAWLVHPKPGAGNYLGRAITLGLIFWMFSATLGTVFRVPHYYVKAWPTAVTRIIAIVGWGLIVGWLMRRWDYALEGVREGSGG